MRLLAAVLCIAPALVLDSHAQTRPDIYASAPRIVSRWNNHRNPSVDCKNCAAGEAMAEVVARINSSGYAARDNPPCGDARFDGGRMPTDLKQSAAQRFLNQPSPPLYALAFVDAVGGNVRSSPRIVRVAESGQGQAPRAGCARLIVTMPKEARVLRIVKYVNCPMARLCGFGGEPVTEEVDKDLLAISVVAKNWSNNQPAAATLQVHYKR